MTTEEFLLKASTENLIEERWRELLKDFLTSCDMVKFARYRPTVTECDTLFNTAVRFVKETSRISQQSPTETTAAKPE